MTIQLNTLVNDSFDIYKAVDAVNASFLKKVKTSPLSALKTEISAPSKALQFGSLYHKYILERDDFWNDYFIFDESKRPEPNKTMAATANKEWKNGLLQNEKREIIEAEEYAQAEKMGSQLQENNPYVFELLKGCKKEVSLYVKLNMGEYGTHSFKCRFDAINVEKGYILDLKTAQDASPFGFSRDAGKYCYHIQAAFYMFLAKRAFNKDFKMYFAAQETKQPFNSALYNVSEVMRSRGENELLTLIPAALTIKKQNLTESYNIFSGNENGIFDLDIPSYYAEPRQFNL